MKERLMNNQEQLRELIKLMPLDDLHEVMKNAGDDSIWRPFLNNCEALTIFQQHIQLIEESKVWPKSRNKEKGDLLEALMQFVFSRFVNVFSFSRANTTDNEIDLNVKFNESLSTPFISEIKSYLICECKNMISSSVDVGMVTKLVELCSSNRAGLGMFISIKGISGQGWKYGEGKRRKLFLSDKIPVISITFDEIKTLASPDVNFYTIIQKKYRQLVDEMEYDGQSISGISSCDPDFIQILKDTITSLVQIGILSKEERELALERIKERYEIDKH